MADTAAPPRFGAAFAGRRAAALVLRLVAVIGGGYGAMVGATALLGLTLPLLGMARGEAVLLAAMLGFPLYLGLIIWGFAERRLLRVTVALGGGAVLSIGLAAMLASP